MEITDVVGTVHLVGRWPRSIPARAHRRWWTASSTEGFPVEGLAIVGRDLEIVERVTGWRAPLAGGAPGALAGAAFGLVFGLWFTPSLGAVVLCWFAVGTLGGAGFELFALSRAPGRPAVR